MVHPLSCLANINWASTSTFDLRAEQALPELSTFCLACLLCPYPYLTLCLRFPSTVDSLVSLLSVYGSTLRAGAASRAAQLRASNVNYLKGYAIIVSSVRSMFLPVTFMSGYPLLRKLLDLAISVEDATALSQESIFGALHFTSGSLPSSMVLPCSIQVYIKAKKLSSVPCFVESVHHSFLQCCSSLRSGD